MRLTGPYIEAMVRCVRRTFSDPLDSLESITIPGAWRNTRQAWLHWCRWTHNKELRAALEDLRGPRQPPPKVRVLPTVDELRLAAEDAARAAPPLGPLRWILYLSGLRISEVCEITRQEAEESLTRPEFTIRQKSAGHRGRRTWTPGCLVRPALAYLLYLPVRWSAAWALLAGGPRVAIASLRRAVRPYRPHDYRHATARLHRRLGAPAEVVSAILGHDLTAILGTTAIYAPPTSDEIEASHARLGAYLWPDGLVPRPGSWLEAAAIAPQSPWDALANVPDRLIERIRERARVDRRS